MNFVNYGSDLNTLKYLAKSISPEVFEECLGKSETTVGIIEYTNKRGTLIHRHAKLAVGEDEEDKKEKKTKVDTPDEKKTKTTKAAKEKKTSKEDKPAENTVTQENPKKAAKPKTEKPAKTTKTTQKKTAKAEPEKVEQVVEEPAQPEKEKLGPYTLTDKNKHLVPIKSLGTLPEHLKKLKIPPAWTDVYVSSDPKADLQVLGTAKNGKHQRLYSEEYEERRDAEKYQRIKEIMANRMKVATIIQRAHAKQPEEADCLELIFKMGIRPDSGGDTKAKVKAFGATTLKGEHVVLKGGRLYLDFIGKKGVHQVHEVTDPHLRSMLIKRKRAAGNKGNIFNTKYHKLAALLPEGVKVKDLRTMMACHIAQEYLKKQPKTSDVKEFTKLRNDVGDVVSKHLGNQRVMALNSYIDPDIFSDHSPEGFEAWKQAGLDKKELAQARELKLSKNESIGDDDDDD